MSDYNKLKRAAIEEACNQYRIRASEPGSGGTFTVGSVAWKPPMPKYDTITAARNERLPVKISQIVERQTGPKQLQFTGDVQADAKLVMKVVDQHLIDGQ